MPAMRYVTEDMMGLIADIAHRRLRMVLSKMQKQRGLVDVTQFEFETIKAVRAIHDRFAAGDYRMSEEEWGYTRDLCNWLATMHAQQHGHPDPPPIEVCESGLWTEQCRAPGTYGRVYGMIASGRVDQLVNDGGE